MFFGGQGGVLSGRLEKSKQREESIVKPFFKMWGTGNRTFSTNGKKFDSGTNVC